MRLLPSVILIAGLAVAVPAGFAQESKPAEGAAPAEKHEGGSGGEEGGMTGWKWANFLVLAGGLGYLAKKNGGAFFDSRLKQIGKDIESASALREEAEARAAEIDRRMARLDADIKALREEARQEA